MEYQRDEHRIHLIVYHLVWCPKRRRRVLVGPVAQDCAKLIRATCEGMGWKVLDLVIEPDHVHLCVRAWPTTSAYEVVRQCKGRTSHDLRQKYKHLRRLPSLWTRAYLSSTAGTVSPQTIQRYIEAQKGL